jgi:hypothetical protein
VWSWPLPNLSWLQAQSVYDGLYEGLGSMNFFIGRIDEVRNRSLCALWIGYGYVVQFVFRRATPKALGGDPHDLAAGLQCFIGHACHGGTVRGDLQPLVKVPYLQTDPLPEPAMVRNCKENRSQVPGPINH